MQVTPTVLPGVLILAPKVFADARGFFLESFNERRFVEEIGAPVRFVQDNHSRSARGVLRGLHLQKPPHAQGKLVRVSQGRIFDVAVDVDPASPTYKRWVGLELDDVEQRQIWIPAGYAHGFLVLSESADLQYKTTDYYAAGAEVAIRWDDPELAIAWPTLDVPYVLSDKDRAAPTLAQAAHGRSA
jgi:dTDP-4-dehydrorhamnose 3,5-epimerase